MFQNLPRKKASDPLGNERLALLNLLFAPSPKGVVHFENRHVAFFPKRPEIDRRVFEFLENLFGKVVHRNTTVHDATVLGFRLEVTPNHLLSGPLTQFPCTSHAVLLMF